MYRKVCGYFKAQVAFDPPNEDKYIVPNYAGKKLVIVDKLTLQSEVY
jgi:hypothetical protein